MERNYYFMHLKIVKQIGKKLNGNFQKEEEMHKKKI